jgi:hypothetical protein
MADTNHTTSNLVNLHAEHPPTTVCPVTELDRQVEAAMAAFNAAEEKLLAGPLVHRICAAPFLDSTVVTNAF